MKKLNHYFPLLFILIMTIGLSSCSDDDGMKPDMNKMSTFNVKIQNVNKPKPVLKSGTFSSPGKGNLGPDVPALFPGESASFTFDAPPSTLPPLGGSGMHLNLATMFVQSNDLFYAFPPEGLDLYDDQGKPVTGDVTDQLVLYDAGTEKDTAPGTGPDQKPAQDAMTVDQGPKENENVNAVADAPTNDFTYPDTKDVIKVTIQHSGDTQFTVTVENVSKKGTINSMRAGGSVPLSPGVWAVYEDALPFRLFKTGKPASKGIELLAEDGFAAHKIDNSNITTPVEEGLADVVAKKKGLTTPLSPPVYAVHSADFQAFTVGEKAPKGIEILAEDGFPADMLGGKDLPPDMGLVDYLKADQDVSTAGAAPNPNGKVPALEPAMGGNGEAGEFTVKAKPGQHLSVFTMFVQSNDLFYAFQPGGIALFDQDGTPVSGNVTSKLVLWDAGTEMDQEPGVGLDQKPRQGPTALDKGPKEDEGVNSISNAPTNSFSYPKTSSIIKVTITPVQQ